MKIGIGLPATIPGVTGDQVLEWAKKADAGPYSSLGIIDRLVYPNFEPLITLAAAAAVTQRVWLMTTILVSAIRNAGVLAKQAATLDAISGGRLTLGLGLGGREDDYDAAPAQYKGRGKRFDEQLELLKRVWSGQPVGDGLGTVGPLPVQSGGPEILIGALTPAALRRVGRWGDGVIIPGSPDSIQQSFPIVEEAWQAEGREASPRLVAAGYYALGPGASERGAGYVGNYYEFMGPASDYMVQSILSTSDAVRGAIDGLSQIGVDEFILWPTVADLDQIDRVTDLLG